MSVWTRDALIFVAVGVNIGVIVTLILEYGWLERVTELKVLTAQDASGYLFEAVQVTRTNRHAVMDWSRRYVWPQEVGMYLVKMAAGVVLKTAAEFRDQFAVIGTTIQEDIESVRS